MASFMNNVAFVFALCFTAASAKCAVDGANCMTELAEEGLSLFQYGTSRSFVVNAHASAGSKLQMSEPKSSFLLENGVEDDIQDDLTMGMSLKKPASASISDAADASFYFRICLDIMIFLIVMDGVRRYRAMSNGTAQPETLLAHALMAQKPRRTCRQVAKEAAAGSESLNEAIRMGDVARCAAILEDADPLVARRILGEPDLWGCNALHLAAASGSAEIVSMLIDAGESCGCMAVRVNAVDVWDQTPLHFAARAGSVEVCKTLLDRGALLNAVDAQEYTALHVAAKLQHEVTCEFLLDQGAGVHSIADANIPPMLAALMVKRILQQHPASPPEN